MLDVIGKLKDYLYAQWDEIDPAKADVKWTTGYSESEKSKAYPQINIDQIPEVRSTKTFIVEGVYRVEEEVLVTVLMRPDNNTDTVIDAAETTFLNMKTEIDEILNIGRFSVTNINQVELVGWTNETNYEAKGRIVFKVSQIVKCVYYLVGV